MIDELNLFLVEELPKYTGAEVIGYYEWPKIGQTFYGKLEVITTGYYSIIYDIIEETLDIGRVSKDDVTWIN